MDHYCILGLLCHRDNKQWTIPLTFNCSFQCFVFFKLEILSTQFPDLNNEHDSYM